MTAPVHACELPAASLLQRYRDAGAYTDSYAVELCGSFNHAECVEAFYTTAVFRLERLLLAWLVSRPSTDEQARELACGQSDVFSAWRVEARAVDQVLLCDFRGRTRSWLMRVPSADGHGTRLYFGSAVVPLAGQRPGKRRMGAAFRALLGFHRLYSRVLLRAAARRLLRTRRSTTS